MSLLLLTLNYAQPLLHYTFYDNVFPHVNDIDSDCQRAAQNAQTRDLQSYYTKPLWIWKPIEVFL